MADSENECPSGPDPENATPARGLLSLGAKEPAPIRCVHCGQQIGGTAERVHVKAFSRSGWQNLIAGEHGAWCARCERLTVWRVA